MFPMQKSPNPLQSDVFRRRVEFLRRSQWWSRARMEADQLRRLRRLLTYAGRHVPYYRELFRQRKLEPDRLESAQELQRLPFLTKQIIQQNYDRFLSDEVERPSLQHRSTGGSTGTPLTIYMHPGHIARDKANTEFYMNVVGLNIFDYRSVRLYGDSIPDERLQRSEYGYVTDGRKLVMSCYHVSRETAGAYVQQINTFAPAYIHSRPSAILPLSKQIRDLDLRITCGLQGIFLDGEVLTDAQRDVIESAFACRVYLVYGHTEGCCVCFSCPSSRDLHVMPQVGLLELLRSDGSPVEQDGESGEMVVTGFSNFVFPLIRYRTFDIGVHSAQRCACGRQHRLLRRVQGRVQDYVVNRGGTAVPVAPAIFNYNDMDWKGIRQFQVRQEREGRLLFRVVREPDAGEPADAMRRRLLAAFDLIFGGMFELALEYVEDIPRTKIGKFRYLDQALDMSRYPIQ